MTMLRTEGFDWLPSGAISNNYGAWSNVTDSGTPTRSIAGGRTGNGLSITTATGTNSNAVIFLQGISLSPSGLATGARAKLGFAVQLAGSSVEDQTFFGVQNDQATQVNKWNCILVRAASGVLKAGFMTATSGTLSGANSYTGINTIPTGTWVFVELDFKPDNTTGILIVKVNGVTEISQSNIDTQNVSATWTGLVLGGNRPDATNRTVLYDDFYLLDTNGSLNNDLLGDRAIKMLTPNGNGNSSQLVGSDADSTDNYLHVDDGATPTVDDDTSYVESATSGNKDTYAYSNLSGVATVNCVNVKTIGRKVDAGSADGIAVVRSSTTEADSASLGFSTSYSLKHFIRETDPNTSAAWAPSAVDAAEFGVKVA